MLDKYGLEVSGTHTGWKEVAEHFEETVAYQSDAVGYDYGGQTCAVGKSFVADGRYRYPVQFLRDLQLSRFACILCDLCRSVFQSRVFKISADRRLPFSAGSASGRDRGDPDQQNSDQQKGK